MVVLSAVSSKLARVLIGRKSIQEVAERRWVVEPSEVALTPPSVFEPDDLDRVTALQPQTHRALEDRRVFGGRVERAATVAHALRDSTLLRGHLYAGAWHLPLSPRAQRLLPTSGVPHLDDTCVLTSTFVSNRDFGHFIVDEMPLDLLAQTMGRPVRTDDPQSPHRMAYRRLGGIVAEPWAAVRFDRLLVLEDHGQNRAKRARHAQLVERMSHDVPKAPHRGVYLRRGGGTPRQLVNEAEVEAHLGERGFAVVDPATASLEAIVAATRGVDLVVGVEGSQLCHPIYTMARGGGIVALTPADRFNNVTKDFADATGLLYGFTVCPAADGGCRVDLRTLDRVLDRIEASR